VDGDDARDQVVGAYTIGSGSNTATHGFTWRPGYGFRTVNDAGDLVGFYTDAAGNTDGMLAVLLG
jgi:hypothetical protein